MNFSFYIFGNPSGRYNQYPNDYTSSDFINHIEDNQGSRLVLFRELNLMHYLYSENINGNVIGFCLIFNDSQILHPKHLVWLFKYIIENLLIKQGRILKYDKNGELNYQITSFNEVKSYIDEIKTYIEKSIETNFDNFGICNLTTTYNGEKSKKIGTLSMPENEIVDLSRHYNTVVLNDNDTVGNGYIEQIIASLRDAINEDEVLIEQLKNENLELSRQKKQFKKLIILCVILLGCCVGLLLLYNNLTNTQNSLENANNTISLQDITIRQKNNSIDSLQNECYSLENLYKREQKEKDEFKNKLDIIDDYQPFIVKRASFSFSSGYLEFDYYGIKTGTVDLTIRVIDPRGYISTQTKSFYVYSGSNSTSFYISSYFNSGDYYIFEIMYNGRIIGGVRQ